jgi:hypothetical protein
MHALPHQPNPAHLPKEKVTKVVGDGKDESIRSSIGKTIFLLFLFLLLALPTSLLCYRCNEKLVIPNSIPISPLSLRLPYPALAIQP